MKKLLKATLALVLLLTLLPIYTFATNNGPMEPGDIGDLAYIYIYEPNGDFSCHVFKNHKTYNKAISGATYDIDTNTLTLKNFNNPSKAIETNVMGEDFTIKLIGTNKIAGLNIFGDQWGGSVYIKGSGTLEVNKKKINMSGSAVNLYSEYSRSVFKVSKYSTVKLWGNNNAVNIVATKKSAKTSAIVLKNGQKPTIKKDYNYKPKWVSFRKSNGEEQEYIPVYKDKKGTQYIAWDYYYQEPSQIYKLGSKGSDGYYTGKLVKDIDFSDLIPVYSGTYYDYAIEKTYLLIPAGSSAETSIKSVSAKSKGFTVNWYKKSVTGYQVEYATSSDYSNSKKVTITKGSTTSKTISKLKAKKKYYVRVRTYKTVSGVKLYSAWSKSKTVTTKS